MSQLQRLRKHCSPRCPRVHGQSLQQEICFRYRPGKGGHAVQAPSVPKLSPPRQHPTGPGLSANTPGTQPWTDVLHNLSLPTTRSSDGAPVGQIPLQNFSYVGYKNGGSKASGFVCRLVLPALGKHPTEAHTHPTLSHPPRQGGASAQLPLNTLRTRNGGWGLCWGHGLDSASAGGAGCEQHGRGRPYETGPGSEDSGLVQRPFQQPRLPADGSSALPQDSGDLPSCPPRSREHPETSGKSQAHPTLQVPVDSGRHQPPDRAINTPQAFLTETGTQTGQNPRPHCQHLPSTGHRPVCGDRLQPSARRPGGVSSGRAKGADQGVSGRGPSPSLLRSSRLSQYSFN